LAAFVKHFPEVNVCFPKAHTTLHAPLSPPIAGDFRGISTDMTEAAHAKIIKQNYYLQNNHNVLQQLAEMVSSVQSIHFF
jgi:hypothetical protein